MSNNIYDSVAIYIKPLLEEIKVETTKRGVKSVKNISLEDLKNSFSESIRVPKAIHSGFLPENCLSVVSNGQTRTVVIWYPALRCDFTYFNTLYENFPIPRMVFSFDLLANGKVEGYRMAIVEDKKPRPDTKLFVYPFSNVYDDCRICVGAGNAIPTYENLYTVASLPNFILQLPNNDHNFRASNNRLYLGYRELLDHMKDKDPSYYYDHVLIPRKDGKTIQDFINKKL